MALDDYLTKKIEAGQFERVRFFFIFVDMCQEGGVDFYKWIEAEVPYADAGSGSPVFCDRRIYCQLCRFEAIT